MHDQRLVSEEQASVERFQGSGDQISRDGRAIDQSDTRRPHDRRTRRVVFGLTGLLGAAWALVFASRFTSFSF